ncbi:MAG: RidA family protein [Rhodospirillaceae bacterium]|nr:RidA family protein [Rhodospirillaceae bacterium]
MPRHMVGVPGTMPDGSANPISTAIRAGDFVFISGLMAKDEAGQLVLGDIERQTRAVMERLKRVVERAGCSLDDVVKCTVWLTHREDFDGFNRIYQEYFDEPRPARSTVRCDLLLEGARIELEATCYKPRSRVYPHIYG